MAQKSDSINVGTAAAEDIGARICQRRKTLGKSQKALAIDARVNQSQLSEWENGKIIPQPASLEKIARALGVRMQFLTSGEVATIDNILLPATPPNYFDDLRTATQLWLAGLNLRRLLPGEESIIQSVCEKTKGLVRVVLLDPEDDNMCRYGAMQEYGDETKANDYRGTIRLALGLLREYDKSKLDIKVVRYPLGFGLDVIDGDGPAGLLYLRFYPLSRHLKKMPTAQERSSFEKCEDKPVIRLSRENPYEKGWFDFYRKQFFTLWGMGKPPAE